MMTEETTPEINSQSDTSGVVEQNDTTVDQTATAPETQTQTSEPNANADTADETAKTEPQLLAGKYKTVDELVKAYKESEKFVTRSSELEKELQKYRQAEEQQKQQKEAEARRRGFNDADELQLNFDVKNHEFLSYVQAMETRLSGDAYNKVQQALTRYQQTGNPQDLQIAQSYFNPSIVSQIARETALYEEQRRGQYSEQLKQRRFGEIKQNLEQFAKETEGWLDPKERQDIVGMAINITGGDVDLKQVKGLIDALETAAIERYKAEQQAIAENKAVQNSLKTPTLEGNIQNGEKWITKEEYYNMSKEEENKLSDKIIRQIKLENEGKLPRMLTR